MNGSILKMARTLLYYQKYLGMFLVAVGIPIFAFLPSSNAPFSGPEWPLLIGLYTVFFSREKVEDERSAGLRTISLTMAFVLGYVFELITTFLYTKEFIDWHLTQIKHFVVLVLALAVVIFYWMMYLKRN
jgi:hypothetical protein